MILFFLILSFPFISFASSSPPPPNTTLLKPDPSPPSYISPCFQRCTWRYNHIPHWCACDFQCNVRQDCCDDILDSCVFITTAIPNSTTTTNLLIGVEEVSKMAKKCVVIELAQDSTHPTYMSLAAPDFTSLTGITSRGDSPSFSWQTCSYINVHRQWQLWLFDSQCHWNISISNTTLLNSDDDNPSNSSLYAESNLMLLTDAMALEITPSDTNCTVNITSFSSFITSSQWIRNWISNNKITTYYYISPGAIQLIVNISNHADLEAIPIVLINLEEAFALRVSSHNIHVLSIIVGFECDSILQVNPLISSPPIDGISYVIVEATPLKFTHSATGMILLLLDSLVEEDEGIVLSLQLTTRQLRNSSTFESFNEKLVVYLSSQFTWQFIVSISLCLSFAMIGGCIGGLLLKHIS